MSVAPRLAARTALTLTWAEPIAWVALASPEPLRTAMRARGLSNRALARRIGKSEATIRHLLAGRLRTVHPDTAARIETELSVTPGTLFIVRVLTVPQSA